MLARSPPFLVPQKTSRNCARITVYRRMNERGYTVDGLRTGFSMEKMIAHAKHHALFCDVAPEGMRPDEFRAALKEVGLSQAAFARADRGQ